MTRLTQIVCGVLTLTLALLAAKPTAAQEPALKERKLGIVRTGPRLSVSFSYRDVFTPKIKEKLHSGLPTRVMVQINLERQNKTKPVAFWFRSATIVYDLWEEVFIVSVEDVLGRRHARAQTAAEAMKLAGSLARAQVASIASQPAGTYRLRVVVEVNPVSKELVEDIRRWLARPPASTTGVDAQSNFFGSFVGIFVDRRIGQADHHLAFVSQWFQLGEP